MKVVFNSLGVTLKGTRKQVEKFTSELSLIQKKFLDLTENTLAMVCDFKFEIECAAFNVTAYDSNDKGELFDLLMFDETDLDSALTTLSSALLKE